MIERQNLPIFLWGIALGGLISIVVTSIQLSTFSGSHGDVASERVENKELAPVKSGSAIFSEIEMKRAEALKLQDAFNGIPEGGDYQSSSSASRSREHFHNAEWRLTQEAKSPGSITKKDAQKILGDYQLAAIEMQKAIRINLCEAVVTFVDASGSVSKGANVAGVVTRYKKRSYVTSPLAAEYCDASADEAMKQVEVR